MSQEKTHDLHDFMRQISSEMAAEYNRIQKRATEDPGTAGDQGEENWAELLRGWLPSTYKVVTKGRIISQDGHTSPQVDVLVLKDFYPEKLLHKKLYLAAGVAAAFECKTTLKAEHIEKAMETCVKIKNLYPAREGTPYKELHTPIAYGLLAHSHSWQGDNSKPENNIEQKLQESDVSYVLHPRQTLDLLCVADFGTWVSGKFTIMRSENQTQNRIGGSPQSIYARHTPSHQAQYEHFTPIGTLISFLTRRFAWEDPTFRNLVDYYYVTGIGGNSKGKFRQWPISVYSEGVQQRLMSLMSGRVNLPQSVFSWNEWNLTFNLVG